jgi:hypothetical protein
MRSTIAKSSVEVPRATQRETGATSSSNPFSILANQSAQAKTTARFQGLLNQHDSTPAPSPSSAPLQRRQVETQEGPIVTEEYTPNELHDLFLRTIRTDIPAAAAIHEAFKAREFLVIEPARIKTLDDLDALATYDEDPNGFARQNGSLINIGANQTGDMYHVRAALGLHPELNIYIWNVPRPQDAQTPVGKARINSAVQMAEYLSTGQNRIVYSHGPKPRADEERQNSARAYLGDLETNDEASGFNMDVGQATTLVAEAIAHDDDQQTNRGKVYDGIATSTHADIARFDRDLLAHGFKKGGTPYLLVNYRAVGNKPGGVHPEHDTGKIGFSQLMKLAARTGAIPVPMGDVPGQLVLATLQNYWTWPSVAGRGRNAEAALLRHLGTYFNVVGAIGMRSGALDLLAFADIPILSIDVDPLWQDAPEEQPSWSRTTKLESAYGSSHYGTIYTNRPAEETTADARGRVSGEFDPQDEGYLEEELLARHGGGTKPRDRRWHETHPFGEMKGQQALDLLAHIKKDADDGRQDANGIARDRVKLGQIRTIAEQAEARREYGGYDPIWDTVFDDLEPAENALEQHARAT